MQPDQVLDFRLNRRQFLGVLVGTAAVTVGLACVGPESEPASLLPSNHSKVREFIALSVLVTGVPRERLNPEVASELFAVLQQHEAGSMPVSRLAYAAGVSPSRKGREELLLDSLKRPEAKRTATRIAEAWYRGQIGSSESGEEHSVTYTSALGWRALNFTTAPTTCSGTFGHWAELPAA